MNNLHRCFNTYSAPGRCVPTLYVQKQTSCTLALLYTFIDCFSSLRDTGKRSKTSLRPACFLLSSFILTSCPIHRYKLLSSKKYEQSCLVYLSIFLIDVV